METADLSDKIQCGGVGSGRSLPLAGVAPADQDDVPVLDVIGTYLRCEHGSVLVDILVRGKDQFPFPAEDGGAPVPS